MTALPTELYNIEQIRKIENTVFEVFAVDPSVLMEQAGAAAFALLQDIFPEANHLAVICGKGNNGGDGLVVARLAHEAGIPVTCLLLHEVDECSASAQQAYRAAESAEVTLLPFAGDIPADVDVIVDAILGIGVQGSVRDPAEAAIHAINDHDADVLAIDIPSGLAAETGHVLGVAVAATATLTFIGLKQGLLTGQAPNYTGELFFSDLDISEEAYANVPISGLRMDEFEIRELFLPRMPCDHKGHFGHVLVLGGDYGMPGAVRLAGEAALRVGAGLVSCVTRPEHVAGIIASRPELMCLGLERIAELATLLDRATVVIIGPGLGSSAWSKELLTMAIASELPMVVDASALPLLVGQGIANDHWILTPHPGEAATLLGVSTSEVQADRFWAVANIQQTYGGVVVLKGAGTLVYAADFLPELCYAGNPGMATAGMGDVLSGIIGGLVAQGFTYYDAARAAVMCHAKAGDEQLDHGERGMLASDLMASIRLFVN